MLVRTVVCSLPEDVHAAFKNKVKHANLTAQDVITNMILAFINTPELDRIAGVKKALKKE